MEWYEWYIKVVKNYVGFDGRARRKEYWMFILVHLGISVILSIVSATLYSLYGLAVILPSIAVGIRRMHDTNHSGWWLLVPIVNLVFAVTEGDQSENRFGPDPKVAEAA